MKPGISRGVGGRGGLQSLSYSGCAGWDMRETSPVSLGSPHPHAQGPAGAREVHRESRQQSIPHATSSSSSWFLAPFSNPGERSNPENEISLDSLTPKNCQLALTPDPFCKVTGPEKRKGSVWVWKG